MAREERRVAGSFMYDPQQGNPAYYPPRPLAGPTPTNTSYFYGNPQDTVQALPPIPTPTTSTTIGVSKVVIGLAVLAVAALIVGIVLWALKRRSDQNKNNNNDGSTGTSTAPTSGGTITAPQQHTEYDFVLLPNRQLNIDNTGALIKTMTGENMRLDRCVQACADTASCSGVNWKPVGHQCQLLQKNHLQAEMFYAPDADYYAKMPSSSNSQPTP
jgi:hypothetical protein